MSGTAHFPFCVVLWGLTYPWFFLFLFLFLFLSFLLSFGAKNAHLFPLFFLFYFFMRVLADFQVSQISNTKEKGVLSSFFYKKVILPVYV
jgi:hypothetical protein